MYKKVNASCAAKLFVDDILSLLVTTSRFGLLSGAANLIAHNVDCFVETGVAGCSVTSWGNVATGNGSGRTIWDARCRWCGASESADRGAGTTAEAWRSNVARTRCVHVWWCRWIVARVCDSVAWVAALSGRSQSNASNTQCTVETTQE